jgi:hypothetical protein
VTLWYWKFSLSALGLSMIIWLFNIFESNYILAIVFAFGFLYSLLQGMAYKIIPFLSWFHLNSKGYFKLPTIREFIEERYIKLHFFFHILSLVFFVAAYFVNSFIYMASFLFLVSNIIFMPNTNNQILKNTNSKLLDMFNASIMFDKKLYSQDIKGSIAHSKMLALQNIINK